MKWTYFTAVLLLAVTVKVVINSLSIGDSLAVLGIIAAHVGLIFLEGKKEKPVNEQVREEMADMRSKLDNLTIKTVFRK